MPGLSLVLDHLANPPASTGEDAGGRRPVGGGDRCAGGPAQRALQAVGRAHTIPAQASGLRRYYQTVLEELGPHRLMFGARLAGVLTRGQLRPGLCLYRELTAGLSPAERHAIFDGTARRVCQLPP